MNLEDDLRRLFADRDAFDIPVAHDATDTVVTGARRLRRRRRAVAAAAGALTMAGVVGAGVAIVATGGPASAPPADGSLSVVTTTPQQTTTTTVPSRAGGKPTPTGKKQSSIRSSPHHNPGTTTKKPTATEPPPPGNPVAFGPSSFDGLSLGMTTAEAEATGVITPNGPPEGGCASYAFTAAPGDDAVIISETGGVERIGSLTNAVTPEGVYRGVSFDKVRATYPDGSGDESEWDVPVPGNPQARYAIRLDGRRVASMRLDLVGASCG